MSYTYLGREPNGDVRYGFTVKVFRDCGVQSPGQNDPTINITLFRNSDFGIQGTFVAAQTRNYTLRKTTFNECINPRPDICYVVLEYFGTATLPVTAAGYTAAFQRCCRINGINNIQAPTNNLGNTYSIQIPGNINGNQSVENNSPIFVEKDTAVVCFNSNFSLDYSAVDPDGDSLVYEFAPALAGGSPNNPSPATSTAPPFPSLPYAGVFNPNRPLGLDIEINRITGEITGQTPATTGEYVIAVSVKEFRGGRLLAETRKELHVNVANCTIPAAELPLETINCDGLDVTFVNNNVSPAINSYFWDFGAPPGTPGNNSTQARPTFIYPDTGTYIAKLVVNRGQACSDSTTMQVKVYPGFAPGFIADGSCFSNPFQFRDTTSARYGAVNSWRWDFGNSAATNDTSRIRNPTYTYPAPGNYTITFRATSTKGCDKQITVPLAVLDRPLLTLPFKDTLICSIDSLELRALGNGSFSWTPGTGRIIRSNTANPVVFPVSTTTFRVILNDRGCIAEDTVRVNVLPFIRVDAGADTVICRGDSIILRPISQALGYLWTSLTGSFSDSLQKNAVFLPTDSINKVKVTANLGKCQDVDSLTVRTVPYPVARANNDTTICFGQSALLRGIGNGIRSIWTPGTGLGNPANPETIANPTVNTSYIFSVFDDKGCPKPGTDTVNITVIPPVQVFAGRDTTLVYGQVYRLEATSNVSRYNWSPRFGLSDTAILNPIVNINNGTVPGNPARITYRLVSSSPEGCNSSDDVTITVFATAPSIFIPNAFTPNKDGLNDVLRPILAGIQRLDFFRIYNRYGQLIFESRNAENGWDGTFKGNPQQSGNFVYQTQAVDFNGDVLKQKGFIMLIR